ncbi:hypothetical protein HN789_01110 [archaeon]|jgi:histidinol phosphatase-like PHP family hydrolase|nr:hypothetical protein [archaeon]MBT4022129.1 hypothetical protein [archaeon]MBT4272742.1 hypothetical protein [archaeon]MBT4461541.1 hypothetical protein [archaeon]MBT4857691.1 hypothetical protein [archaeon]
MKCDLHFHPNLMTQGYKQKTVIKILDKCIENDLNVIITTEHVFKQPLPAFKVLYGEQQRLIGLSQSGDERFAKYARLRDLHIFPGVEYFTSEGAEFVIFHWDPGSNRKKKL